MLVTSSLHDPWVYAPEGSWLHAYLKTVERTEYPWSYHLLSGMLALGAAVGRRCAVKRSTYTLWPPLSIMLMGESGTGKTEALMVAKRVLDEVAKEEKILVGDDTAASTSPRGWMRKWQKFQEKHELPVLEGAEFLQEIGEFLRGKTGNEGATGFLIDALQHKEFFGDATGWLGESSVKGMTMAVGAATPISTLREAVSINRFEGGFMFRFVYAHELELDLRRKEAPIDETAFARLGIWLREIRCRAPDVAVLEPRAEDFVQVKKRLAERMRPPVKALGGFWRRYPGLLCKLGNLFSLSAGRGGEILQEDVWRADALLQNHLYPPLEGIVRQIAAGPKKRALLRVVDDLELAGARGMAYADFVGRLDVSGERAVLDAFAALVKSGLVWQAFDGRCFASAEWRKEYTDELAGHSGRVHLAAASGGEDHEDPVQIEEDGGGGWGDF